MRFAPIPCQKEEHRGTGSGGVLLLGNPFHDFTTWASRHKGEAQLVIIDPPAPNEPIAPIRVRQGVPKLNHIYATDENSTLARYEEGLLLARDLLSREGSCFVSVPLALSVPVRALCEAVLGEEALAGEIILVRSGAGRTQTHFGKCHEAFLFYRRSPQAFFSMRSVAPFKAHVRRNHMRKGKNEQGRTYVSRLINGQEHRYFDDEPALLGDVWADLAHDRLDNPARSGYPDQRPTKLYERMLLSTTRTDDLCVDLFARTGSIAVAASRHNRRFLCACEDASFLHAARKRMLGRAFSLQAPTDMAMINVAGEWAMGLGLAEMRLTTNLDALDQVSLGYCSHGTFRAVYDFACTREMPQLPSSIEYPLLSGTPAMMTVDCTGKRILSTWEVPNA